MEVKAISKYAKISAFKVRDLTRNIQGLSVGSALDILSFSPQKAAGLVRKTLQSAIANAENNNAMDAANLIVKEAIVGEGPTMKRFQPRARGSAGPILKRTSHIRIVVAEKSEEAEATGKKGKKAKAAAAAKTANKQRRSKKEQA
jgi:large subunit ribosomal protein L22